VTQGVCGPAGGELPSPAFTGVVAIRRQSTGVCSAGATPGNAVRGN
jgi:hypothetical protein